MFKVISDLEAKARKNVTAANILETRYKISRFVPPHPLTSVPAVLPDSKEIFVLRGFKVTPRPHDDIFTRWAIMS
jgi:hypothetical protein